MRLQQVNIIKLLWFGMVALSALATFASDANTLVLAQISERPKKDFKELRPMAAYMAEKLASVGFTQGQVKLFNNIDDLVAAVKRGEVHWISETAKTASVLINQTDAKLLVNKWKNGQHSYASIIYARKDSGINTLSDLKGKVIAFENKDSFSSYFLPRVLIEERGLTLRHMADVRVKPSAEEVGYVFSRNEKNNVLWTAKRLVDAGVINDGDWENTDRVPKNIKAQFKILLSSPQFPRSYEITTPMLSPKATKLLKATLLSMTVENSNGVLARYENSIGFGELPKGYEKQLNDIYQRSLAWVKQ